MTANGTYTASQLVVLPGFVPYPARYNYKAASVGLLSNRALPKVYGAYIRLRAAFRSRFGVDLTYAEAYRSGAMQDVRIREHANGGPLAAQKNWLGQWTSNHGLGLSLDLRNNIGTKSSAEYAWMAANAPKYGFRNDVPSEGWHWTYYGGGSLEGAALSIKEIPEMNAAENKLLKSASANAAASVAQTKALRKELAAARKEIAAVAKSAWTLKSVRTKISFSQMLYNLGKAVDRIEEKVDAPANITINNPEKK